MALPCFRTAMISPEFIKEPRVMRAVTRILKGDYSSSDLERLQGYRDIYSFRLNDTERLLVTIPIQPEGTGIIV